MSQMANITVYDGAATPVVHTLVAMGTRFDGKKSISRWAEQIVSLPEAAQVRVTQTSEKLPTGITKIETRVVVPTMESVSGANAAGYTAAPKVAFEDTYVITQYASPRSTIVGRRLARQLAVNLVNGVVASVASNTAGQVLEAHDLLTVQT